MRLRLDFSEINSCIKAYFAETEAIVRPDFGTVSVVSSAGLPKGGNVGDILIKAAEQDYRVAWESPEVVCPKEIFMATYQETSYDELEAARQAGKLIIGIYQSYLVPYATYNSSNGFYTFSTFLDGNEIQLVCKPNSITVAEAWSYFSIEYAQTASAILTGIPTAPTAPTGTDTTQIATTAFVQQELSNFNAIPSGGTEGQALVKASDNDYDVIWAEAGSGNANILVDTTAGWNSQLQLVGQEGFIYVYSDYMTSSGQSIPGIKIGDGLAYLIDLPFVEGGNVALAQHIADGTLHITAAEREFWNNKVTCFLAQSSAETLVFSKD